MAASTGKLGTTNPRQPATISPSVVLNRTQLIAIPYLSVGHYNIDVGTNGRANDALVFSKPALNEALQQNHLNIPTEGVFLADDAFPLRTNILKPYTRATALNKTQPVFNYRLSIGRRVVENSFGIFAARFRIFLKTNPIKCRYNRANRENYLCFA